MMTLIGLNTDRKMKYGQPMTGEYIKLLTEGKHGPTFLMAWGWAVYGNLSSCERRPYDIIGAGWDTGPNLHEKSTNTFKWIGDFGDAFESAINDSDPLNPIYYVTTSGNDFDKIVNGARIEIDASGAVGQRGWDQHFVKAGSNQDILFYAGNKAIGRSTDAGDSWQPISVDAQAGGFPNRLFLKVWNNPSNENVVYTQRINADWQVTDPNAAVLYRTTNAMATASQVSWSDITPVLGGQTITKTIHDIAVDDENQNKIWITYSGYTVTDKVLKYENNTWTDITGTGLEGQNVTSIKHQEGTDDLLYVGTHSGVYYKKDHETSWTKITGLPNCPVTDMEISYCISKVRVSTSGRGIWETDLIKDFYTTYLNSSNDNWGGDRVISGEVVIDNGQTLTITGNVYLSRGTGIVINPGGKLIIDGGHLTNYCGSEWSGIFVVGNDQLQQTPANQGVLQIINNGKISNARHAITNAKYGTGGNWFEWGTSGGIIYSKEAVFENNYRDVQLVGYHSYIGNTEIDYQARFIECEFSRTPQYELSTMQPHVTMSDVVGVRFEGCSFTNTINTTPDINSGKAIYSLNSTYTVNSRAGAPAEFKGYYWAIDSRDMCRGDKTIKILNTSFENNKRAIYLSNTGNAKVVNNTINVLTGAAIRPNTGVYFDESFNYSFHGNTLEAIGTGDAIGVVFHHNGTYMNEAYDNSVDGFSVGFEAIGINRDANNDYAGLTFRCNEFGYTSANVRDIWVVDELDDPAYPNDEYGVAAHQGSNIAPPQSLANNFWNPLNTTSENFWNDEQKWVTYFHGTTPSDVIPINTKNVAFASNSYNITSSDCPIRPSARPSGNTTGLSDLASADQDLSSDESLLQQLIDDGDSPELEAQILAANSQDHQNLYVEMMGMSPYVSIENLLNIIEVDGFPELALRNIMVANPQSSREGEVWEALENRVPALSQQTLNDISDETQTITTFDLMYARITQDNFKRHLAIKDLLYYYEGDSTDDADITAMENLLSGRTEQEYHYMLIENQIARGEYSNAQSTLNNMVSQTGLVGFNYEEYTDLQTYYNIVVSALTTGEPRLDQLEPADLNQLGTLAATGIGLSRTKARNLLERNGIGHTYEEPLYLPGEFLKKEPISTRVAKPQTGFRIFPNPTQSTFSLQWNWFEDGVDQSFYVEISDLTGKQIYSKKIDDYQRNNILVAIDGWSAGTYMVKLSNEKKVFHVEKLIITK